MWVVIVGTGNAYSSTSFQNFSSLSLYYACFAPNTVKQLNTSICLHTLCTLTAEQCRTPELTWHCEMQAGIMRWNVFDHATFLVSTSGTSLCTCLLRLHAHTNVTYSPWLPFIISFSINAGYHQFCIVKPLHQRKWQYGQLLQLYAIQNTKAIVDA